MLIYLTLYFLQIKKDPKKVLTIEVDSWNLFLSICAFIRKYKIKISRWVHYLTLPNMDLDLDLVTFTYECFDKLLFDFKPYYA